MDGERRGGQETRSARDKVRRHLAPSGEITEGDLNGPITRVHCWKTIRFKGYFPEVSAAPSFE